MQSLQIFPELFPSQKSTEPGYPLYLLLRCAPQKDAATIPIAAAHERKLLTVSTILSFRRNLNEAVEVSTE
ncbi:hypothetical protein J2X97_002426 [Epilithonimonas hungarica]|nr:hypothetical protein [Epilithonimonas hungarica]